MAEIEKSKAPLGVEAAQIVRDLAKLSVPAQIINIDIPGLGAYPNKVPFLYDPEGHRGVSLKPLLEEFRTRPERREGTATVETLASFIALVARHKTENSAIFGKTMWPEPKLTAVLDYHGADADHTPAFLKHRVVYTLPVTEELKAWMKMNGQGMEQGDFAAFLEEHAAELVAPSDGERFDYEPLFKARFGTPAELISLSRDLEIHAGHQVKRQERLQTGERVVYFKEEHMQGDGQPVDIPGIFMVAIPAFLDGEPVRIPARLRYRLSGGITWFYQLYRWEWWLRDRVFHDMQTAASETGLPAYEGAPEK